MMVGSRRRRRCSQAPTSLEVSTSPLPLTQTDICAALYNYFRVIQLAGKDRILNVARISLEVRIMLVFYMSP